MNIYNLEPAEDKQENSIYNKPQTNCKIHNELDQRFKNIKTETKLIILGLAGFSGILFNVLFYKQNLGISVPLFVGFLYLSFFLINLEKLKLNFFGVFSFICNLLLSATFFIYSNPFLLIINGILIPILFLSSTTLLTQSNEYKWYRIGFIEDILYQIGLIFQNSDKSYKSFPNFKTKEDNKKDNTLKNLIIAILISAPLVIIILGLLFSADKIFAELFSNFFSKFNFEFDNLIPRSIFFLISFTLTGSFLYIYLLQNPKKNKAEKTPNRNIESLISNFVLSIINAIYLLFIIVQINYLFNGNNNQFLENMTYAEYAREGFHQLIMVSIINFSLILWQSNKGISTNAVQKILLKSQLTVLSLFTLIILYSAHTRLSLYEDAYGYTYIRFFSHYTMYFLVSIGAISFYKIAEFKASYVQYSLISLLIFYTGLNYLNPDAIIASRNLNRYEETQKLDLKHFASELSLDGLYLLKDYKNDTTLINNESILLYANFKGKTVGEGIEYISKNRLQRLEDRENWPEFNISQFKFIKEFTPQQPSLDLTKELDNKPENS